MKKLLSLIIIILSLDTVYCQDKCPAVIEWHYIKPINIYDKPDGKIIHQMKNDTTNEDLLHLDILKQNNTHFYVSINLVKDSATGWIKKADYIGAYKRHEEFPMDLTLYKDKKISDANKITIKNWTPTMLTIEMYADKWVFVSLKQKGMAYSGWIQANELCANSYTYCN